MEEENLSFNIYTYSKETLKEEKIYTHKGKRNLKNKVKSSEKKISRGYINSKEAHKYLSGHLGYMNIADTKNLEDKIFLNEDMLSLKQKIFSK